MIHRCKVQCYTTSPKERERLGIDDDPGKWLPFAIDLGTVNSIKLSSDNVDDSSYGCSTLYVSTGDTFVIDTPFIKMIDNDLRLILDYADRNGTCCAAVSRVVGPTAAAIAAVGGTVVNPPNPYEREMYSNADRGYDQGVEEWGSSAELNWDTGIGTLTSITSYRSWDSDRSQDIDFTQADILYRAPGTYENNFDTFTQELRLAGESGPIEWLVGAYYVNEELTFVDAVPTGNAYENYANLLIFGLNPPGGLTQLSTITGPHPPLLLAC